MVPMYGPCMVFTRLRSPPTTNSVTHGGLRGPHSSSTTVAGAPWAPLLHVLRRNGKFFDFHYSVAVPFLLNASPKITPLDVLDINTLQPFRKQFPINNYYLHDCILLNKNKMRKSKMIKVALISVTWGSTYLKLSYSKKNISMQTSQFSYFLTKSPVYSLKNCGKKGQKSIKSRHVRLILLQRARRYCVRRPGDTCF